MFKAFSKPTIDMKNYITVDCFGIDTIGNAQYTVDIDKLESKLEKVKLTSRGKGKLGEYYNAADYFYYNLNIYLDKSSDLSNGDKIQVIVDGTKEMEKYYKVKFKNTTFSTKASGLQELVDYGPFDGLSFTFNGYFGKVTYEKNYDEGSNAEWVQDLSTKTKIANAFSLPKDYNNLSEGDSVEVTLKATM